MFNMLYNFLLQRHFKAAWEQRLSGTCKYLSYTLWVSNHSAAGSACLNSHMACILCKSTVHFNLTFKSTEGILCIQSMWTGYVTLIWSFTSTSDIPSLHYLFIAIKWGTFHNVLLPPAESCSSLFYQEISIASSASRKLIHQTVTMGAFLVSACISHRSRGFTSGGQC